MNQTKWGVTGGRPRILWVDARAYIVFFLALMPWAGVKTWAICFATLIAFSAMERYRITIDMGVPRVRRRLAGDIAPPFPVAYIRRHFVGSAFFRK